eukprot:1379856-Amorphochlora_amoeboformis.AAC.1
MMLANASDRATDRPARFRGGVEGRGFGRKLGSMSGIARRHLERINSRQKARERACLCNSSHQTTRNHGITPALAYVGNAPSETDDYCIPTLQAGGKASMRMRNKNFGNNIHKRGQVPHALLAVYPVTP